MANLGRQLFDQFQAKAKWAQLRRMRAMIGYREEKLKRQAKIKSKSLVKCYF